MGEDTTDTETATAPARATECRTCATRLAPDQRYCLTCGTRRGALPYVVAQMVEAMLAHTLDPIPRIEVEPVAEPEAPRAPWPFVRLPGPQALTATLLAALGFGVLAGSLAPAPIQALASAPMQVLVHLGSGFTNSGSNSGADSGNSADASASPAQTQTQTQQTITVTTPAPPTSTAQTPPATTVTTPTSSTPNNGGGGGGGLLGLPPIKHVFLIVLADQGFSQTFDPASGDTYLSRTLPRQGELVEDYYGIAGSSLANGVALISGQGPTALSVFNCPQYTAIEHPTKSSEGQVVGSGCVYPKTTPTIADQLVKKGLTWRAYVDGIDTAKTTTATCRHPALGASDPNFAPVASDPYLTWRNPFVYFRSLTTPATCAKADVGLDKLARDLRTVKTTPTFSYIVPSPCEDGDATPCRTGAPAGLPPADAFLRKVIAEIKRSPAYKADGLIAITFDHAPQGGPHADANACCSTPVYPNLPAPTPSPTTPTDMTTTPTTTGTTTT
ncbi:MAG: phosphatidylinositol-3-phosphatase, partial [Solirubrobacteraceae bacterium]|nr:phosphatidylinositol-3-phosphatase [Solirubrobacteraceae bacterium]